MYKTIFLALCLVFGSVEFCSAQISGNVVDENGAGVSFANVLLLNAADSTMARGTLSDEMGGFGFDDVIHGRYLINVNLISYGDWFSPVFEIEDNRGNSLGNIVLKEELTALEGVELTAVRKMIKQNKEGTVVHVQSSVMTKGSTALQLLERSPGVVLDQRNGNFLLNGKSGTLVMIDGKPMRFPTSEIMTLLNGISGDNIKKIELLANPSSKYDADGNAGIINIVLNNGENLGFNGALSLTGGAGFGPKQTSSLSLNSATEKLSLYGSYSFSYDESIRDFVAKANNNVPVLGGETETLFQSDIRYIDRSHNLNLGIGKQFSKKSEVGGDLLYNYSNRGFHRVNNASYTFENDDFLKADIHVDGTSARHNLSTSAFYGYKPDDSQKLTVVSDYIHFKNTSPTIVNSRYTDANGVEVSPENEIYDSGNAGMSETKVDVGVVKLDYEKQWGGLQVEAGAKYTVSKTISESGIEVFRNGEAVADPRFENHIDIDEKISAFYASVDTQVDSLITLTTGVRYEHWDRKFSNGTPDRKFGKIFPSIFLSKQFESGNSLVLSYNKRISRPSYIDLSPSLVYNDPTSVFSGNALLRPAIINNISLALDYGDYHLTMGYSHEDNPIARFQTAETQDSDFIMITPQNVDYQTSLFVQADTPIRLSSWWKFNVNTVMGTRKFKIVHTPQNVVHNYLYYTINASQTLKLPKKFTLEVSGVYNSDHYSGSIEVEGFGFLNAGIKKEFKGGGSLQFSVTDLLQSMNIISHYGALTPEAYGNTGRVHFRPESTSNRVFKLSYIKSFGNKGMKGRNVNRGSDEEKSRLN